MGEPEPEERAHWREAEAAQTAVAREFSPKWCPTHLGQNGRPSMCCLTRFERAGQEPVHWYRATRHWGRDFADGQGGEFRLVQRFRQPV
jgi:hypothetical protein